MSPVIHKILVDFFDDGMHGWSLIILYIYISKNLILSVYFFVNKISAFFLQINTIIDQFQEKIHVLAHLLLFLWEQ